jgi:hypothetical protein
VLAIIAVLVSLTAAAVIRVMGLGPDAQTRSEISQLETALTAAKNELHPGTQLEFLPSVLVLREDCNYGTTPIELATIAFLKKAFGKRIPVSASDLVTAGVPFIDWNGNGSADQTLPTSAPFVLDGGQCLVFWLGGIPDNSATATMPRCGGFSTNPVNPADTANRKAPYFDFKPNRLQTGGPGVFYYYADPYSTSIPYSYFTSYPVSPFSIGSITNATSPAPPTPITISSVGHGLANGQMVRITGVLGNTAANGTWAITNVTATTFDLLGSTGNGAWTSGGTWSQVGYHVSPSDCNLNSSQNTATTLLDGTVPAGITTLASYNLSLFPYQASPTQWLNPTGFQIISAGRDGMFGNTSLGTWNPATGWGAGNAGADDISNFSRSVLGTSQN